MSELEIRTAFKNSKCLMAHVYSLVHDPETYLSELRSSCETGTLGVDTSSHVRSCIIAALHISSNYSEMEILLPHCDLDDIVAAVEGLDYRRYLAKVERVIENIEHSNPHLKKRKSNSSSSSSEHEEIDENFVSTTRSVYKYRRVMNERKKCLHHYNNIFNHSHDPIGNEEELSVKAREDETVQKLVESASMSVTLRRVIRNWAKNNLSSDYLEYVMLMDGKTKEDWKKFASIVRFSPTDFKILYFLSDVYGGLIPKHSFVAKMRELVKFASTSSAMKHTQKERVAEKFLALAETYPQTYKAFSFIRSQPCLFSNAQIVNSLAENIPLDTAIVYYKELCVASQKCEGILVDRLTSGGKMERNFSSKTMIGDKCTDQVSTCK